MNATPPWSRRRATQPARVTVLPTCSARRLPASCVRITGVAPRRGDDGAADDRAAQVDFRRGPRVGVRIDLVAAADVLDLVAPPRRPGTTRTGCPGARRSGSACRTAAGRRATSVGMPRARSRSAIASLPGAGLLVGQATSTALTAPSGRRSAAPGPSSGTKVREMPKRCRPLGRSSARRRPARRSGRRSRPTRAARSRPCRSRRPCRCSSRGRGRCCRSGHHPDPVAGHRRAALDAPRRARRAPGPAARARPRAPGPARRTRCRSPAIPARRKARLRLLVVSPASPSRVADRLARQLVELVDDADHRRRRRWRRCPR